MLCSNRKYCGGIFPTCYLCETPKEKEERNQKIQSAANEQREKEKNEKLRIKEKNEKEAAEAMSKKGITYVQHLPKR